MTISIFSISDFSHRIQRVFGNVFLTASSPFSWLIYKVSDTISSTWNDVIHFDEKLDELKRLKIMTERKKRLFADNQLLIEENIRLRKLLDYKNLTSSNILFEESSLETEVAEIIMRNPQSAFQSLIINKGTYHGIRENMPVIAFQVVKREGEEDQLEKLVVGKIVQTSYLASKIIPLTSLDCFIHVKLRKTNYNGFVQGRESLSKGLLLTHVDKRAKIELGEEVITSGGQSIFPKGIKVGIVTKNITTPCYIMSYYVHNK